MKNPKSIAVVALATLLACPIAYSQTTPTDLDRDGIPNISDRDVDNDGVLNGADRNIDGGTAQSGPLRGQYIGDNLLNNSPQELDMDADGLADGALNESDIDGDGLSDVDLRETDIDGDGLADAAALETDIDGDGLLDGERRELDIDGDGLADNAANETDIDSDGLLDNAANESDIDGDGLTDDARGEVDIDGDGSANGLDGDVDGDGLVNSSDPDMYGTELINDIFRTAGAEEAYAADASVASTIAFVSGEVRRILQIPATDNDLRVRVQTTQLGNLVTGVWRYLSADNIQVWAKWCYSANNPSDLKIAVIYQYSGPYSGNPADYTNPANYTVSEENRVYAQFPGGGITFVSWVPPQPAGFYYTAPNQQATGFAPPYQPLVNALASLPNFTSDQQYLSFSGNLGSAPGLPSLQPVINLQRTIMQVSRTWYGQLEAAQIR